MGPGCAHGDMNVCFVCQSSSLSGTNTDTCNLKERFTVVHGSGVSVHGPLLGGEKPGEGHWSQEAQTGSGRSPG